MAGRHSVGGQYFFPPMEKPSGDEKSEFKSFDSENNQAALQKILLNRAETCEEKFKILDARDKLYKLMQYKIPTLKRKALPATCPDMCPEKERLLREYQARGSIFEMSNFSRNSSFNHCLAVKEYARSSADQEEPLPHELRPISVLMMTMSHLLHNVADCCELTDDNLEDWYMFMWDRTRALRKELTQQGVCCLESVTLVEQCARFHIHCAERLVDQDSSIYDDKINTENLTKCLQTLKYMYKDLAKEDIKCPNEPEFVCYTLLLNLNNSSVFTELSDMSESLMASQPVKFALDVMTTWETRNYIRFFDLVKKTTYLNCCLLRRYFGEMRLYAIKTMIRSYCTKNYSPQMPVFRFVRNLNFEGEEECLNFLSECNFNFREVEGMTVVNFNRLLFQNPQSTLTTGRAHVFIEEKKTRPLSVVLAGGTLPPKLYENHVPENSFTQTGHLKSTVLAKFDLSYVSSVPPATSLIGSDRTERIMAIEGEKTSAPSEETGSMTHVFQKEKTLDFPGETDPGKPLEKVSFSGSSIFPKTEPEKSIFGNAFGQGGKSGSTSFSFAAAEAKPKTIFDPPTFQTNVFGVGKTNFGDNIETGPALKPSGTHSGFSFGEVTSDRKEPDGYGSSVAGFRPSGGFPPKPPTFSSFKFQIPQTGSTAEEEKSAEEERQRMEEERRRQEEEKERERERRLALEKEEEEKRRRLMEESRRVEMEKKEREKREREERLRKEEQDRLEREERRMREEEEERRQKAREAEIRLRKMEEDKRKEELDYRRKVDREMGKLNTRWRMWKTKMFFDKWRMKTWTRIEERKMKEYFREVRVKYPPICTEELLNSNPYGLIIPSSLVFEKFRRNRWRTEFECDAFPREKKLMIVSDELPLLKITTILGRSLEARAKCLSCKMDPYPWKLVISVPDKAESSEFSKSIETFIEMHFVDDLNWEFGVQKGPLYCQNGGHKSFQYRISVRRVRGCDLYEGTEPNPSATEGTNAVVFVLNGTGNETTRARLRAVMKSIRPFPKVPLVLFSLTDNADEENRLKESLETGSSGKYNLEECHVVSVINGKHDVVSRLVECVHLAAAVSSPPSSLRVVHLSEFFTETLLDSLWRRISISLSNFKIVLDEPKILIEFYNSCIDYLAGVFLEDSHEKTSVLGEEFSEGKWPRPVRTHAYAQQLRNALERMKLGHWPAETPKSCHQLNYRIHQYCKKMAGDDRMKIKNLKWLLYRIIRRALLWKGLDIYCDEDIREIVVHFPWIEVFQEISRILSHRLKEDVGKDSSLTVIYDVEKIEKFTFETSLISKLLKRSRRKGRDFRGEEECDESSPCLENDSVIYAYSAAIERESNKRKRETAADEGLGGLFSRPSEKRLVLDGGVEEGNVETGEEEDEVSRFDLSQIEQNFHSLDERLNRLKKQTLENESILMDIHYQLK